MLVYAETVVEGRYSEKRLAKVSEWWHRRHNPLRRLKRLPKVREVLQYRQSSTQVYLGTNGPLQQVRDHQARIYIERGNVGSHRKYVCQRYMQFCNIGSPVRKNIWVPGGGPLLQVRLSSAQIYREGQRGQSPQCWVVWPRIAPRLWTGKTL